MDEVRCFSSKHVDLRTIPDASAERIAHLLRGKRERAAAEAKAVAQQDQTTVAMCVDDVEAEERTARDLLRKTEQKDLDKLHRSIQEILEENKDALQEYQRHAVLEKQRQQKVEKLHNEVLRESFWNFMQQQRKEKPMHASLDRTPTRATIDDATEILSHVYEESMLPFAADPHECWQRGVTVPPSLQKPVAVQSPDRSIHVIPPYHAAAQALRDKYHDHCQHAPQWWRFDTQAASPSYCTHPSPTGKVVYRSTPIATYVHNFPYTQEPVE